MPLESNVILKKKNEVLGIGGYNYGFSILLIVSKRVVTLKDAKKWWAWNEQKERIPFQSRDKRLDVTIIIIIMIIIIIIITIIIINIIIIKSAYLFWYWFQTQSDSAKT